MEGRTKVPRIFRCGGEGERLRSPLAARMVQLQPIRTEDQTGLYHKAFFFSLKFFPSPNRLLGCFQVATGAWWLQKGCAVRLSRDFVQSLGCLGSMPMCLPLRLSV